MFYKRLYNTLPEQEKINLEKKLEKFENVQKNFREKIFKIKKKEEENKKIEKGYNRTILIDQLKRKIMFGKEWKNECEKNWKKNLVTFNNRKKFFDVFKKKKKI